MPVPKVDSIDAARWPRPGQGARQDVARRVHVPVERQAATRAFMPSVRKLLSDLGPAAAAKLARPPRIDFHERGIGFLALLPRRPQKQPPSRVGDRTGQPAVPEHVPDSQALHGYRPESTDQASGSLVNEVPPLLPDPPVDSGQGLPGLVPSIALPPLHPVVLVPLRPAPQGPVGPAESRERFLEEPGIGDLLPAVEGREGLQPHVDPDGGVLAPGGGGVAQVAGGDQEPLVPLPLQGERLDLALDVAIGMNLDPADPADPYPLGLGIELDPVAGRRELDHVKFLGSLGSGMTPFGALPLASLEEGLEGSVQPPQGCLGRAEVQGREPVVVPTLRLEPTGLLRITDGTFVVPSQAPHPQAAVVEVPMGREHDPEVAGLGPRGAEGELEGTAHSLFALLVLYVRLDHGLGHEPGDADIIASGPERREPRSQGRVFLSQHPAGKTFELVGDLVRGKRWRRGNEYVDVVWKDFQRSYLDIKLPRFLVEELFEVGGNVSLQNLAPILRAPDEVIVDVEHASTRCLILSMSSHADIIRGGAVYSFFGKSGKEDAANSSAA